jgi:hypothetical protein
MEATLTSCLEPPSSGASCGPVALVENLLTRWTPLAALRATSVLAPNDKCDKIQALWQNEILASTLLCIGTLRTNWISTIGAALICPSIPIVLDVVFHQLACAVFDQPLLWRARAEARPRA